MGLKKVIKNSWEWVGLTHLPLDPLDLAKPLGWIPLIGLRLGVVVSLPFAILGLVLDKLFNTKAWVGLKVWGGDKAGPGRAIPQIVGGIIGIGLGKIIQAAIALALSPLILGYFLAKEYTPKALKEALKKALSNTWDMLGIGRLRPGNKRSPFDYILIPGIILGVVIFSPLTLVSFLDKYIRDKLDGQVRGKLDGKAPDLPTMGLPFGLFLGKLLQIPVAIVCAPFVLGYFFAKECMTPTRRSNGHSYEPVGDPDNGNLGNGNQFSNSHMHRQLGAAPSAGYRAATQTPAAYPSNYISAQSGKQFSNPSSNKPLDTDGIAIDTASQGSQIAHAGYR